MFTVELTIYQKDQDEPTLKAVKELAEDYSGKWTGQGYTVKTGVRDVEYGFREEEDAKSFIQEVRNRYGIKGRILKEPTEEGKDEIVRKIGRSRKKRKKKGMLTKMKKKK